jgi:hypothetical protein
MRVSEPSGADGFELPFRTAYVLSEGGEVALEDYARVLAQAEAAEALRSPSDPGLVRGVRLRGVRASFTEALARDIEDFARGLSPGRTDSGLGWS